MRILFVAPFGRCQKQTVNRRLLPLAQATAAGGWEVELLIPAWDCPADAAGLERVGGVTVRTPRRGPALHPLFDALLLQRMWAAAQAFQPQVVFVSKPMGYAAAVGLAHLRRGNAVVLADLDDLENAAGWGAKRPHLWQRAAMWQEQQMLREAHGVIAASLVLRTYVRMQRRFRDDVLYLPNGLQRAATPATAALNAPIVLLYTRGNDVDAGHVERLWHAILARAPQAQLHIVGDWVADSAPAPALPQCQRIGWLQGDARIDALRAAAVAIFPVTDTLRTAAKSPARLLDCLAEGVPVVTERVGEYDLLAGAGGWVAEVGDTEEMAAMTAALLHDPMARAQLGQQSWQQAGLHTWEQRARTLMEWVDARWRATRRVASHNPSHR